VININNTFPANPAATPGPGIDPMNNPHLYNTTNLHVHGVQVIPHIFEPVGTSDPTAMMVAIQPGTTYQYSFAVPPDQPTGLYWYHPHHHGSTDVEVSGGMAGLILVKGAIDRVPEIAAARDVQLAFQTINVNASTTTPGVYELEYNAYKPPSAGGYKPRSDYLAALVNGQLVNFIDFTTGPVCGASLCGVPSPSAPPQMQMQPGEVVRLRMLNGSTTLNLPLQLPGLEVYVIAYDGVNLLAPQLVDTVANPILLTMAGRVELLLRAPSTPGSFALTAQAVITEQHPWPPFNLLQINVSGSPVSMSIPASLPTPTREYPLIADGEITGTRSVLFSNIFPSSSILFGTALTVNGAVYNETSVPPEFVLPVGAAEKWTITNNMNEGHPFHLHTNSFEVHSITGASGTVNYSPPIICDTIWVPANGNVVMRVRYKQWRGKDVFHCHKLVHEDQGMMANTLLV
ncbi:MAG TPA: multicopper oxidase family protein, partial [Candidatus Eremiobacteraceae bacterium]|nr:multicopper oxidase family protein [Candidatus Eremiobacteraceae bacterium]